MNCETCGAAMTWDGLQWTCIECVRIALDKRFTYGYPGLNTRASYFDCNTYAPTTNRKHPRPKDGHSFVGRHTHPKPGAE